MCIVYIYNTCESLREWGSASIIAAGRVRLRLRLDCLVGARLRGVRCPGMWEGKGRKTSWDEGRILRKGVNLKHVSGQ